MRLRQEQEQVEEEADTGDEGWPGRWVISGKLKRSRESHWMHMEFQGLMQIEEMPHGILIVSLKRNGKGFGPYRATHNDHMLRFIEKIAAGKGVRIKPAFRYRQWEFTLRDGHCSGTMRWGDIKMPVSCHRQQQ